MKLKFFSFLFLLSLIFSCSKDNDITINPVRLQIHFSHAWDASKLTKNDFNEIKFTNENGEQMSIERLRYLISDVTLTHKSGTVVSLDDYQLVDLEDEGSFLFSTSEAIIPGDYTQVSFRFGFKNEDNIDGAYTDLNTANFNVPGMLGGGYHFMQMDGKFINDLGAESPYNFHAIRAVNNSNPSELILTDTSFTLNLGDTIIGGNTTIKIEMDVSAWFKSPTVWDLNALSIALMPNYDAQILISQNGSGVFNLLEITQ